MNAFRAPERYQFVNKRDLQKQATREKIKGVAFDLLMTEGPDKTTSRRIAQVAGIASGTVFAHFPEMHLLYRELLHERLDAVLAAQEIPEHATASEFLHINARALYGFYCDHWYLAKVVLKETLFDQGFFAKQVQLFVQQLQGRLIRQYPELGDSVCLGLATALFSQYFQVLLSGLSEEPEPQAPDRWLQQLVALNEQILPSPL